MEDNFTVSDVWRGTAFNLSFKKDEPLSVSFVQKETFQTLVENRTGNLDSKSASERFPTILSPVDRDFIPYLEGYLEGVAEGDYGSDTPEWVKDQATETLKTLGVAALSL